MKQEEAVHADASPIKGQQHQINELMDDLNEHEFKKFDKPDVEHRFSIDYDQDEHEELGIDKREKMFDDKMLDDGLDSPSPE